jgi:hypothetical protein
MAQNGRVEIGAVGPDKRVNFGIDTYLFKERSIFERTVQFALEDRRKVDPLFAAVRESDIEGVGPHDFETGDSMDRVFFHFI